jgi:hypothetical protein
MFIEYFDSSVQLIGQWDAFFEIKAKEKRAEIKH